MSEFPYDTYVSLCYLYQSSVIKKLQKIQCMISLLRFLRTNGHKNNPTNQKLKFLHECHWKLWRIHRTKQQTMLNSIPTKKIFNITSISLFFYQAARFMIQFYDCLCMCVTLFFYFLMCFVVISLFLEFSVLVFVFNKVEGFMGFSLL